MSCSAPCFSRVTDLHLSTVYSRRTCTESCLKMWQETKGWQWLEMEYFTFSLCEFACAIASICFSISTTTVMISTVISLICKNSLAVLTTAKPLPPYYPGSVLQHGLWGSVLLWAGSAGILKAWNRWCSITKLIIFHLKKLAKSPRCQKLTDCWCEHIRC